MQGWIYRLGVRIKDWGERIGWSPLVRFGLCIRDKALTWVN